MKHINKINVVVLIINISICIALCYQLVDAFKLKEEYICSNQNYQKQLFVSGFKTGVYSLGRRVTSQSYKHESLLGSNDGFYGTCEFRFKDGVHAVIKIPQLSNKDLQ